MTKKIVWLVVSCLMAISLIMASCGPVDEEEAEIETETRIEKKTDTKEEAEVEKESTTPQEGPLYGGTITLIYGQSATSFDPSDASSSTDTITGLVHSSLIMTDWYTDRDHNPLVERRTYAFDESTWKGYLAESWDRPDPLTIVFKIKQGIRWQNKAPVNGREFTAEDVEWHFNWILNSPKFINHTIFGQIESVTATGKYEVAFKLKNPNVRIIQNITKWSYVSIVPHEVVEQYGDYRDWETHVGTGPWMMVDYVPESAIVYERNPDFFLKDEDGNSIPYLDGVRSLIILDEATQITALRIGKADMITGKNSVVSWKQKATLEKTNPELLWQQKKEESAWLLSLRNDVKPFDDIRVRKALSLAINYEEMRDSCFGGNAVLYSWPTDPDAKLTYTPYEEQPDEVKEWYWKYDPVKAKELLADAGYPNGFNTSVDYCATGSSATYAEAMELVQAYWADIGVNLDLQLHDNATLMSMRYAFTYKDIVAAGMGWNLDIECMQFYYLSTAPWNRSRVNDPWIDEQYYKAIAIQDADERYALTKELFQYCLEGCYSISLPVVTNYAAWWPWMANYNGECTLSGLNEGTLLAYLWMDQSMKKSMLK